ncbi:cytochrome P450 [Suillus cothurnatus]|nr:cytochrome P450 [Suillus cothurnatus]
MSRSWVSPGISYLARSLLSVVVPVASSVVILVRLASLKGVRVSPWLISTVVLGAAPLVFAAHVLVDGRLQQRKANRLGARLVPRVQGKWPGNLDKLVNMVLTSENEYLGRPFEDEMKVLGPTINFRFFWEDLYDDHGAATHQGAKFREAADSVLGTGVFNSDGKRAFAGGSFMFHFEIFDRHADHAIALAKERFRAGLAIDFQDLISRFTLDSASEFLFGHEIIPLPPSHMLSLKLNRNNRHLADSTAQHMKVVNAFLDPILKDALEKRSMAVSLTKTNLQTTKPYFKIIKDETLNILLAGRDTLFIVGMHPEFLTRLREEIISKVGLSRRPTYEDIKEMKYLRAVLNETLRLFPAVTSFRENIRDTTWISPEHGKKPLLSYSVFLMHRRTDLWGPDGNKFIQILIPNPYIFLPFNAGPRICLGQQFAYNEMSFMVIRLLQSFFTITLCPEPAMCPPAWWAEKDGRQAIERFRPRNHLTLYAMGGMWVKMEAVDDVEIVN